MHVHINTCLRPEISVVPFSYRRKPGQFFSKITWNTVCRPACLDLHDNTGQASSPGLRYKTWSFQVIEKMRSDEVGERSFQDFPVSSSYETAMEALSSLIYCQKRGDKSSIDGITKGRYGKLERMHIYLKMLGLEEQIAGLKIIHVAGTKGKGSTCIFCEAILRECGFRTGLFTSPHLIDVRERFRIDGLDISEDKFLQYFWDCWNQLKEKIMEDLPMPPLFQFLTLLAFKIFTCEKVDVAIIEVGLGGMRDSTNVIKEPLVCGISSLGMDHTEVLGKTLAEIASHKAGIFKPQIPAFTVPQPSEAMDVLQKRASNLMVPLEVVHPLDPEKLNGVKLSLSGDHQFINAGLAVALCRCWLRRTGKSKELFESSSSDLPEEFLRGLSTAYLSGRAQVVHDTSEEISYGDLIFYLDGAHSPESMEVCAKWFSSTVKEENISSSSSSSGNEKVKELWSNCAAQHGKQNFVGSERTSKQVLLFNCMDTRDPKALLPQLVNTCASSGIHFSKALFVPSMSTYNKVTSGATVMPTDCSTKDLSWQFTLQRIWEKIMHGKDATLEDNPNKYNPESLTFDGSLYGDFPQRCNPSDRHFACSAVIPSLPLTIKWLRDSVKENPSVRVQVLVTGSLHLVGDVLKLLRR
ncbi:folylpolyglutamate synthase-like isoform X2 [Macadamia integrifolia]|uniref:folylpolyglutamate synthase-like isoform X2 n=1 Tax=Macadamia integrifolia TaxID=60698 RepID=UPI001C532DCB|nr:folylpolyglutamate synthase-like isoform X2 [Macadamia integrifolia]